MFKPRETENLVIRDKHSHAILVFSEKFQKIALCGSLKASCHSRQSSYCSLSRHAKYFVEFEPIRQIRGVGRICALDVRVR